MGIVVLLSLCLSLFLLFLYVRGNRRYHTVLVSLTGILNHLIDHLIDDERKSPRSVGLPELDKRLALLFERLSALQRDVQRQRKFWETLVSHVSDSVFILDEIGMVKFQNPKAKEAFGELEGRSFLQIPDLWLREAILKIRKGEEVKEIKGQKGFFGLKTLRLEGGELMLLLYDLTPYRRLEEFKRELLAKVSHEIRTPLTAIKGFYEALKEGGEDKGRYSELLERNLDRLTRLVEGMLSLAELESKHLQVVLEEIKIKPLVEEVIQLLMAKAKAKGLEVETYVQDINLRADPLRIFQLLYNLLDNAIRYTDKGKVTLAIYEDQTNTVIEVSDTGIGIPEEEMDKIFEPFYVVDRYRARQTGGLGLGLAIVKQIVELHKGHLEVKSQLGKGTTFKVSLPI